LQALLGPWQQQRFSRAGKIMLKQMKRFQSCRIEIAVGGRKRAAI